MYLCENRISRDQKRDADICRHPFRYKVLLPVTSWIIKIIPATTRRKWMSPPPIFNITPSNQMTINATMISQRIRPMYIPPNYYVLRKYPASRVSKQFTGGRSKCGNEGRQLETRCPVATVALPALCRPIHTGGGTNGNTRYGRLP